VLLIAFLVLGLGRKAERAAIKIAVALSAVLLLAVSLGKL
jgi:hypothetical protein